MTTVFKSPNRTSKKVSKATRARTPVKATEVHILRGPIAAREIRSREVLRRAIRRAFESI